MDKKQLKNYLIKTDCEYNKHSQGNKGFIISAYSLVELYNTLNYIYQEIDYNQETTIISIEEI